MKNISNSAPQKRMNSMRFSSRSRLLRCLRSSFLFLIALGVMGMTMQAFSQTTLPVSATFSAVTTAGPGTMPTGFTQTGLGGYGGALKFDSSGDFLTLFFDAAPGTLSFDVGVNNSFPGNIPAGAKFDVQESSDGSTWAPVVAYSNIAGGAKSISTLSASSRYVRWVYTTKPTGTNIALKNIALASVVPASSPTISSISPAAALDGTSVTIIGTNLTSPTSVTFTMASGPASASITSTSATQIVCTVPTGTITGTVTVTT
ncbi:MAG: IPT/TIG domain-containing protein, partial [Terrimicrobiaceae bacterium]